MRADVIAGIRATLLISWIFLVLGMLGFYFLRPELFSSQSIADFLRRFSGYIMVAYLAISVTRAFFLIPSTPFVLAGVLLLPDRPWTVLLVSVLGVVISATLIYFFSDQFGLRERFERSNNPAFGRVEKALNGRYGFPMLVFWAFFPLAPTDLACYVAGIIRMRFWWFLGGICLGKSILCSIYVFAGRGAVQALIRWFPALQ